MSITGTNTKHIYDGNGVTQTWPYTFDIVLSTDIKVYITDDEGTVTNITTNFTVDTNNNWVEYPTIQTPLVGEILPTGWKITLVREEPLTQEVDWKNQGRFNAEVLEQGLDKLTMITQQLEEKVDRSVKFPIDEIVTADDTDTFLSDIQAAAASALASESASLNYKNLASGYASSANGSSVNAATSESNALSYKNLAYNSEVAAAASESNALNYRNSASGYATTATTMAGTATTQAGLASGFATSASGYASTASSAKNDAESARDLAQGYSTTASNAKDDAVIAKNAAEHAQGDAEAAQSAAEGARDSALGYRNEAEGFKDDASGFATTASSAKDDAVIAKNAAEHAQGDAETAQGLAEGARDDASGFASAASGSASDASGYASAASNSAGQASGYADDCEGYYNEITTYGKVKVRNETGSTITGKLVKVVGDYATDNVPTVAPVSAVTDRPIAYVDSLATATTGEFLKRGRKECTGFDCSGATNGDKVYCTSSGDLTLSVTAIEVGIVEDNTNPGIVYFNIGGAGSSASVGTYKRLGCLDIDGSTNTVDTDYGLYTVPAATYAKAVKVYICNRNAGYTARIRLAHVDGAVGDVVVADYILFDDYLLPYETKIVELDGMVATDTLLVRSSVSLVNFEACGEELTYDAYRKRVGALDIDGATNAINTDKVVYTSDRATKVNCILCNRNSSYVAEVQLAHVNSDDIADIADEDRKFFTLDVNQSLFLELDLNMATAEIISFRSDTTNVNCLVYLSE